MTGIDLNTAFDNKDVITQIHDLKKGKQDKLTAGENITIVDNVISATGGSGGGVWGSITGTLSAQTDLQTALNGKQATGDYATNTALTQGLATKQPIGNYATQTDLQQGLATRQPLGDYQARLTAGSNITITDNVISASSSSFSPYSGTEQTIGTVTATAFFATLKGMRIGQRMSGNNLSKGNDGQISNFVITKVAEHRFNISGYANFETDPYTLETPEGMSAYCGWYSIDPDILDFYAGRMIGDEYEGYKFSVERLFRLTASDTVTCSGVYLEN